MKHAGPYFTLGLVGRAGAGKDSSAEALSTMEGFTCIAFAEPLRAEIARSFGIDSRMLSTRHTKELPATALTIGRSDDARFIRLMAELGHSITAPRSPRQITRWWGTEYRRNMDGEAYWTLRMHERIEALHAQGHRRIAITDVRFPNEAEFVRELGGQLWRIRRRAADSVRAAHSSESQIEQISCDREIHNERSLDHLAEQVLAAYADSIVQATEKATTP
jgi:hypothetical protein